MTSTNKMFYPVKLNILQLIKFAVYTFLLVNFGYYILDDWRIAQHTLSESSTFLDWTAAFTTSIDESAWFVLLLLFELETYALTDEALTKARLKVMHVVRVVCYLFLAHTIYANAGAAYDLLDVASVDSTELCDYASSGSSYTYNYDYSEIDEQNCSQLASGGELYALDDGAVITDQKGLNFEQYMSKLDLIESLAWIAIVLTIELMVRLQDKGVVSGRRTRALNVIKLVSYCVLWIAIGHWIYFGHYVYAWDEFVWIAGFAAIEMNVADWRKEIIEDGSSPHTPAS